MAKTSKSFAVLILTTILLVVAMLCACGGFGGRYKIKEANMDIAPNAPKIPLNVRLVLDSKQCTFTYTSVRQGAKRIYELGEALCANNVNIFKNHFKNVTLVSSKDKTGADDFDITAIPRLIDTSVLVRPGAPPRFEATIIYECAIEDSNGHTIFVRTIKENKVIKKYGYGGYAIIMQEAIDELFAKLAGELADSPEIRKFVQDAYQAE